MTCSELFSQVHMQWLAYTANIFILHLWILVTFYQYDKQIWRQIHSHYKTVCMSVYLTLTILEPLLLHEDCIICILNVYLLVTLSCILYAVTYYTQTRHLLQCFLSTAFGESSSFGTSSGVAGRLAMT